MKDSFDPNQIKIRKSWPGDFNPETKIEQPKPKKKNRSAEKQNLRKALQNVNSLEDLDDLEI